jgi:hypothetical protein
MTLSYSSLISKSNKIDKYLIGLYKKTIEESHQNIIIGYLNDLKLSIDTVHEKPTSKTYDNPNSRTILQQSCWNLLEKFPNFIKYDEYEFNPEDYGDIDEKELDELFILFGYSYEPYIKSAQLMFDNRQFIIAIYNLLWVILERYALGTYNLENFITKMIDTVNRSIRKDYIIKNCNENGKDRYVGIRNMTQYDYCCGRAMYYDERPNKKSRIIIFNTISDFDDNMDFSYYGSFFDNLPNMSDDEKVRDTPLARAKKYLKYKIKYIKLKN